MASDDQIGCEPLRIWSRLEPRARRPDFDRALQARIHDPLWMLARQWQFGEFKGEDTGSAIVTKIARKVTPVSNVRTGSAPLENYPKEIPLEAHVERLPIEADTVMRAHTARRFFALLDHQGAQLPQSVPAYDAAYYRSLFRRLFPLDVPNLNQSDRDDAIGVARQRSRPAAHRMLMALANRTFDGVKLLDQLRPGMTWTDLPSELALGVLPEHAAFVLRVLEMYRAWWAALYVRPRTSDSTGWNASQLEYQFACTLSREGDTVMTLGADEYATGRLDWYSFEQNGTVPTSPDAPPSRPATVDIKSVIPTPAEFAGMPNPRWWQFEDAAVDLGHIHADATDVAKIAVAEFALLYGNNWLAFPCRQEVGTLAEIEGMVVTDVFGWRTSVRPATGSSAGVWTQWDFFSLSPRNSASPVERIGQHLFLPPVLGDLLEGDPVESVALVRDETTNTVWAVETRIPDHLGEGADGSTLARRFCSALKELEPALQPQAATPSVAPGALWRFRLGTTVPENWIPFVPVHKPRDTRAIRLQRASMPRFFLDTVAPVRPLTTILREGVRPDDTQDHPYFIHEEEIPSAGIVVEATFQRTRWFDGVTLVWLGRRKTSGRGEGGSGLRFDAVEPVR